MVARTDTALTPRRLQRRRAQITAEIAALGPPLPGSLVERRTRCGNPGCRCHADPPQLHGPYLSWTRKVNNRTVTRTLSTDQADRYRALIDNARRLRQLVAELENLAVQQVETHRPARE
jgi:hypothetical protein